MTEVHTNGNGLSQKDLILRLETKLDTYIANHTDMHKEMTEVLQQVRVELATHRADDHAEHVWKLNEWKIRKEGSLDLAKALFGTSVIGLLAAIASLIVAISKMGI